MHSLLRVLLFLFFSATALNGAEAEVRAKLAEAILTENAERRSDLIKSFTGVAGEPFSEKFLGK